MASSHFQQFVQDLWKRLGLSPPSERERSLSFHVEGLTIFCEDAPDERHALLTGQVGRLSADPPQRERQVSRLLQLNLAHMSSYPVCVYLDKTEDLPPLVKVQIICPYDSRFTNVIIGQIEALVSILEIYTPELRGERGVRSALPSPPRVASAVQDDLLGAEMIFRL